MYLCYFTRQKARKGTTKKRYMQIFVNKKAKNLYFHPKCNIIKEIAHVHTCTHVPYIDINNLRQANRSAAEGKALLSEDDD